MYMLCQAIIIPLYFGFLLYCPNADFAGVVVDGKKVTIEQNRDSLASPVLTSKQLLSPSNSFKDSCHAGCGCSASDFDPVCSLGDGVTHFNPCLAGCATEVELQGNVTLYGDCACAPAVSSGDLSGLRVASRGFCSAAKCDYFYFALFVFLQVFFTFAATMPGLVASLR